MTKITTCPLFYKCHSRHPLLDFFLLSKSLNGIQTMLKGIFYIISCPLTNVRLISSEIVNAKVKKRFSPRGIPSFVPKTLNITGITDFSEI